MGSNQQLHFLTNPPLDHFFILPLQCEFLSIAYDKETCINGSKVLCAGPFYPNFESGFCLSDGQQTKNAYTFDSPEVCVSQHIIIHVGNKLMCTLE